MKFLILAGGSGTRLWPLSRLHKPKQVQPFLHRATLLQDTWRRLRKFNSPRDLWISTTLADYPLLVRQLPELLKSNVILEPLPRGTAAAVGMAASLLGSLFPGEAIATINSDHYVANDQKYQKTFRLIKAYLNKEPNHLCLIGLKPTYPETGYGYIKIGRQIASNGRGYNLWRVSRFIEKPALKLARRYLASKNYLWNSGIFIFHPDFILQLYKKLAPQHYQRLVKVTFRRQASGAYLAPRRLFKSWPNESIDYAVVEKAGRFLLVVAADFGWADVGNWRSVYDIVSHGRTVNVTRGRQLNIGGQGNLIYGLSGRLVATVGLNNMAIVDTPDALLVCPLAKAQEVKKIVVGLKKNKFTNYL